MKSAALLSHWLILLRTKPLYGSLDILCGYWNEPSYQYSVHIYLYTEDATSVETDAEEGSHVLERQGDLIIARGMQQDVSLWEKNSQIFSKPLKTTIHTFHGLKIFKMSFLQWELVDFREEWLEEHSDKLCWGNLRGCTPLLNKKIKTKL